LPRSDRTPSLIARLRGTVRDRELEVGASAHYDDPDYYGSTYQRRVADVAYYVDLARKRGGPVLELGVGNGRIAVPIARHGVSLTGVDASRPMLADLTRRLIAEPPEVRRRIRLVTGDIRKKKLGRKFPLVICPFNTALHLFTRADIEAFFARVREHLAPRGLFVVDLSTPQPFDLARDPEAWHGAPPFRHPSAGRVRYRERFEYDALRQILFVTMKFSPIDGASEWITPLAHRQFFPAEWEALLHYNGLTAIDVHGDFAGGPLTQESDVMIWHARKR
jgi:SAM-dependent methyltransferase